MLSMTPVASLPAAGRELDALVAERVMGHPGRFVERVNINDRWWDRTTWLPWEEEPEKPHGGTAVGQMPPRYSTDIETAWKVVERLRTDWRFLFQETPGRKWRAMFSSHRRQEAWFMDDADTAPLAICRAALKAVAP